MYISTGTTRTIGKNPRTCITFDKPQSHGWYHSAKGVRTGAPGVVTQRTCGLVGNCGLFRNPLKLGIPLFERNRIVDVSVSVWFKREGGRGCWPVLSSKGNPRSGTIQVLKTLSIVLTFFPLVLTFFPPVLTFFPLVLTFCPA